LEQNSSLQDSVNRLKQQQQRHQGSCGSWEKLRRSKSRRLDPDSCPQQQQLFDSPLLETVDSLRWAQR
jgi:hypothetical protein